MPQLPVLQQDILHRVLKVLAGQGAPPALALALAVQCSHPRQVAARSRPAAVSSSVALYRQKRSVYTAQGLAARQRALAGASICGSPQGEVVSEISSC